MAPQGISIDPNLLVNAQSRGNNDAYTTGAGAQANRQANTDAVNAQTVYNYGTGAQANRQANTDAVNAQTVYNYGAGAQELRQANIESIRASATFNYGERAQDQRTANIGRLEASTAATALSNDVSLFELNRKKAASAMLDDLNNNNARVVAEDLLAKNEIIAGYHASPRGTQIQSELISTNAENQLIGIETQAQQMKADFARQAVDQNKAYTDSQKAQLSSTQELENLTNVQQGVKAIDNAVGADFALKQQGVFDPTNTLSTLELMQAGNPSQFAANNEAVLQALQPYKSSTTLTTELRQRVDNLYASATHQQSGKTIVNTVGGMVAARGTQAASPTNEQVLGRIHSIGLNTSDPASLQSLTITKSGVGYRLNNTLNGQSNTFSESDFQASPELQKIYVNSEQQRTHAENPANAGVRSQETFRQLASKPFTPEHLQVFDELSRKLAPYGEDATKFTLRLADSVISMQKTQQIFNPVLGPESAILFAGSGYDKSILGQAADSIEGVFGYAAPAEFERYLRGSRAAADDIAQAYYNRATGGMPPEVYKAQVDQIVQQTTVGDPDFQVSPTNPIGSVQKKTERLTELVKRSLIVPQAEQVLTAAFDKVKEIYPDLAANSWDESGNRTSGASFLDTLSQRYLGAANKAETVTSARVPDIYQPVTR